MEESNVLEAIEFDYNELVFLFMEVRKLAKSSNSATVKSLYKNISIKLEKAILEIDRQVKTSTNPEFTSLNIEFFESDNCPATSEPLKPYDPNWMNKTD